VNEQGAPALALVPDNTAAGGTTADVVPMSETSGVAKPKEITRRRSPPRVKLRRIHANLAKAYPPDGETKACVVGAAPARARHNLQRVR
jgi:hypothetical protein